MNFKSRSIDITPLMPSRLTGMSNAEKHQGVHSKLEINALVFNQNEKNIYIFSVDTLFISKELKKFICEKIELCFGATSEMDIIIMSTHTHYAPSLEEKRVVFRADRC